MSHLWLAWLVVKVSEIFLLHPHHRIPPEGIHAVRTQLGLILDIKINDFNLEYKNNYVFLTPHKYLKKTTWKKLNIFPQPWTKEIMMSTILNIMNLCHFGRYQEVNMFVKLLLSCYHGGNLWLDRLVTMDPMLIHMITELIM
jgi:hypothetical protein